MTHPIDWSTHGPRLLAAAEILTHSAGVIRGRTPEDDDTWTVELEHIRELNAAIATAKGETP